VRGRLRLIEGKPYLSSQTEASVAELAHRLAHNSIVMRKSRGLVRFHFWLDPGKV
jgi:hypothetical protein